MGIENCGHASLATKGSKQVSTLMTNHRRIMVTRLEILKLQDWPSRGNARGCEGVINGGVIMTEQSARSTAEQVPGTLDVPTAGSLH